MSAWGRGRQGEHWVHSIARPRVWESRGDVKGAEETFFTHGFMFSRFHACYFFSTSSINFICCLWHNYDVGHFPGTRCVYLFIH